jgi:hypothetical protein
VTTHVSALAVLFDPDEHVCVANEPHHTVTTPIISAAQGRPRAFLCINPLASYDKERGAGRGRRADANVTAYRTMLLEFDELPSEEQVPFVLGLGLPYTMITFSGKRSFHFLISLADGLPQTRAEYRQLVERVYKAVGGKAAGLDTKVKNPSRFSRMPGAIRPDTGAEQTLIDLQSRVTRSEIEQWLAARGVTPDDCKPIERAPIERPTGGLRLPLKGTTQLFLIQGARPGEWNQSFFNAACDMVRCGYTPEQIYAKLERVTGELLPQTITTIRSAIARAEADLVFEQRAETQEQQTGEQDDANL